MSDLEEYRKYIEMCLKNAKDRIDRGLSPRCGLRIMCEGSAVVVPDTPDPGERPFYSFSLDSREPGRYKIASEAASELVRYAANKTI